MREKRMVVLPENLRSDERRHSTGKLCRRISDYPCVLFLKKLLLY